MATRYRSFASGRLLLRVLPVLLLLLLLLQLLLLLHRRTLQLCIESCSCLCNPILHFVKNFEQFELQLEILGMGRPGLQGKIIHTAHEFTQKRSA